MVWGYPPCNMGDQWNPCNGHYAPDHFFPSMNLGVVAIDMVSCATIPDHMDTWQVRAHVHTKAHT